MFKFIYKSLLIAVISGSMTTMNFAYALGPAGDQPDPTTVDMSAGAKPSNTSSTSPSASPNWIKDKDGTLAQQEKHDIKGVSGSDMLASITMFAVGVIGTRLAVAYTPKTTDVYVAAAGAAAFIAGEIMSNLKFSGEIKDQTVELTKRVDGKTNNEQIEILNKLKKSYEDAKGATETKRMLQWAAAAAFGVAMGISVYQWITEETANVRCHAAMTMANTQLKACGNIPPPATTESAACLACMPFVTKYETDFKAKEVKDAKPEVSAAAEASSKALLASIKGTDPKVACAGATAKGIASAAASICDEALAEQLKNHTAGNAKSLGEANQKKFIEELLFGQTRYYVNTEWENPNISKKSTLDFLLDTLIPSAQAGWMPIGGLGVGVLASYFAIQGPLAIQVDSMLFHPRNRAIIYGVLAGLSAAAALSSGNQIKEMEDRIKKIQAMLDELNGLTKGMPTGGGNPITVTKPYQLPPGTFGPNSTYGEPPTKIPCLTPNCTSMTNDMSKSQDFKDLPSSFQQAAMDATKLGDSLSGPKGAMTANAAALAGNLAAKQSAIGKLAAKAQNKLNNQLGKKKIDFGKEQQALLNKFNATVAKALKSKGQSPAGFLSSLGGRPFSGTDNIGAATNDALKKEEELSITKGGNALDIGTGADGKSKDKDFDLGLKENSGVAGGEGAAGAGGIATSNGDAGDPNAKYEMASGDIASSKDNIFELISNRYVRSGYPVLLEELPAATPEPAKEKK